MSVSSVPVMKAALSAWYAVRCSIMTVRNGLKHSSFSVQHVPRSGNQGVVVGSHSPAQTGL